LVSTRKLARAVLQDEKKCSTWAINANCYEKEKPDFALNPNRKKGQYPSRVHRSLLGKGKNNDAAIGAQT